MGLAGIYCIWRLERIDDCRKKLRGAFVFSGLRVDCWRDSPSIRLYYDVCNVQACNTIVNSLVKIFVVALDIFLKVICRFNCEATIIK